MNEEIEGLREREGLMEKQRLKARGYLKEWVNEQIEGGTEALGRRTIIGGLEG